MANYLSVHKPFSKEKQVGKRERPVKEPKEKKPIKKVSDRQAKELVKRAKLRKELIEESGGLCMICGKPPDFRGLNLIHKKALSAGGKTNRKNCLVGCQKCHGKEYHHLKEVE